MYDFLINSINGIIWLLGQALKVVFLILPNSPFTSIDLTGLSDSIGIVNWFFPVGICLTMFSSWLGCITAYYIVSIALRWIKAVA